MEFKEGTQGIYPVQRLDKVFFCLHISQVMATTASRSIIPVERIASRIYLIRGQKVMLDADLAALYAVPTKVFNQAVRRNLDRFPKDFMFQLTQEEAASLRSQIVTVEKGRGR